MSGLQGRAFRRLCCSPSVDDLAAALRRVGELAERIERSQGYREDCTSEWLGSIVWELKAEALKAGAGPIAAAPELAELLLLALPAVEESEQFDKPRGPRLSSRIRALLGKAGAL